MLYKISRFHNLRVGTLEIITIKEFKSLTSCLRLVHLPESVSLFLPLDSFNLISSSENVGESSGVVDLQPRLTGSYSLVQHPGILQHMTEKDKNKPQSFPMTRAVA